MENEVVTVFKGIGKPLKQSKEPTQKLHEIEIKCAAEIEDVLCDGRNYGVCGGGSGSGDLPTKE